MNIVLTGFMASGKTTVSKVLGERLGYEVIDTDKVIEDRAKKTINEIFGLYGEEYFRGLESDAIKKVSGFNNKIIATGGGAVLNPDNISELRKNGVIFNLAPDFSVIEKRISVASKTRPLMQGQEIEQIKERFISRQKFYDNCDYKINIGIDTTPDMIADSIIKINSEKNRKKIK